MDDNDDFVNHFWPDKAIRLILEGTAAEVGERFFYSLVENLSLVLQTAGAWVTEYISAERRLNSLAFLLDNQWLDNFSYDISGTVCERVIVEKQLVYIPDRLLDLYTGNAELAELKQLLRKKAAISYLGVPFIDDQNHVLGHLSVIDSRTIPENHQTFDIFRIFANRARAELQRLRAEQHIKQSEEKFRKLFDSTFDAILEYDQDFIIKRVNQAAEKLFSTSSTALTGRQLKDFFPAHQFEKLRDLALTLSNQPSDKQSIWIPGGLKISVVNGECFPAEGTLSKYALGPEHYFILILRDEKQRVAAENKIQSMSIEANYLKEEIKKLGNFGEIIGKSEPLLAVLEQVKQVARTNATVLITGETGTGKVRHIGA